jgi:hypothetical protein
MEVYEQQLLEAGIIEQCEAVSIFAWSKMFALEEPTKHRYRLIIEPRDLNDMWKSAGFPHTELPQTEDIRRTGVGANNGSGPKMLLLPNPTQRRSSALFLSADRFSLLSPNKASHGSVYFRVRCKHHQQKPSQTLAQPCTPSE